FTEPWLHQSADEVIAEVVAATARTLPWFRGITLERLKSEGTVQLPVGDDPPFAEGRFPTPSGKVELYCEALASEGFDPLPGRFRPRDDDAPAFGDPALALELLTGAAHHFVSSSLASQPGLLQGEGPPFVEIHPVDAAARGIAAGESVVLENEIGR